MAFVPSIQGYVGSLTTQFNKQANVDWESGVVFLSGDYATGRGVSKFGFSTGVETGIVDVTALVAGAYPDPMGSDFFDRTYMSSSGISNYNSFMQLSADLALAGQWGTSSAGPDYPNGLPFPTTWSCVRDGNQAWMVGTTDFPFRAVWVQSGTPFGFGGVPVDPGDNTLIGCPGMPGTGEAWVLGGPQTPFDTQVLNLYKFVPPALPSTPLGTILPADVDPTAAQINNVGIVIDQTDGNLIAKIRCPDAAVNTDYIVKLSSTDASVLWAVPVLVLDATIQATAYGRIRHGKYCHFCEPTAAPSPATVFVIDTLTGSFTSYTDNLAGLSGGAGANAQCFDDTTGAIILQCSYTPGAGAPTPRNGTVAFGDKWAALYVIEAIRPPTGTFSYAQIMDSPP